MSTQVKKSTTKNMTEGSPLLLIVQFALPLLLGNIFQQTYNMVDAAIVGQILGSDALASVGASSSVQFLVIGFSTGVCCGFAIPIAQRFGAEDFASLKKYVFHSYLLAIVLAILLTCVCAFFCPQILHLMSTPDDIFDGAYAYLLIIFLGIPFTILYNLMAAILRAVGDSRTPFIFLAISTCINIALDLFFILVLHLGVSGAAIATISAQALSGLLCLIHILRKVDVLHFDRSFTKIEPSYCKNLLVMGIPMGLQLSITAIGSMVMQSSNNSLGTIYVTGFTAGTKIKQFVLSPFDAFGTAVSTFCGQNLGAKRLDRVKTGVRWGVSITVCCGIVEGLIMIFFGRTLACLFISADSTQILDAAARYMRCMGYLVWVLGILYIFRQAMQGLGYAGRAIFCGVIEMIARIAVCGGLTSILGYTAICWADQTAWVCACIYAIPSFLYCLHKKQKELKEDSMA